MQAAAVGGAGAGESWAPLQQEQCLTANSRRSPRPLPLAVRAHPGAGPLLQEQPHGVSPPQEQGLTARSRRLPPQWAVQAQARPGRRSRKDTLTASFRRWPPPWAVQAHARTGLRSRKSSLTARSRRSPPPPQLVAQAHAAGPWLFSSKSTLSAGSRRSPPPWALQAQARAGPRSRKSRALRRAVVARRCHRRWRCRHTRELGVAPARRAFVAHRRRRSRKSRASRRALVARRRSGRRRHRKQLGPAPARAGSHGEPSSLAAAAAAGGAGTRENWAPLPQELAAAAAVHASKSRVPHGELSLLAAAVGGAGTGASWAPLPREQPCDGLPSPAAAVGGAGACGPGVAPSIAAAGRARPAAPGTGRTRREEDSDLSRSSLLLSVGTHVSWSSGTGRRLPLAGHRARPGRKP